MVVDQNIGIQMKQEELTKTFMMISKRKTLLVPMVHRTILQRLKVNWMQSPDLQQDQKCPH